MRNDDSTQSQVASSYGYGDQPLSNSKLHTASAVNIDHAVPSWQAALRRQDQAPAAGGARVAMNW